MTTRKELPLRPKVAITVDHRAPTDDVMQLFKDASIDAEYRPSGTAAEVIQASKDADAILVGHFPRTTADVLRSCSRVKAVSRNGVGVDTVDIKAATEIGVCVCNTPAINGPEVADHAIAMLLAMTRKIPESVEIQNTREWALEPTKKSQYWDQLRRIAGNVVGIYGFGNIGRTFAMSIRGFGPMRILAHDAFVRQSTADAYGVELVDFDTLVKESDFITLHAPATPDNLHIFNASAFSKMKRTALLVNCARGGLVDEKALVAALKAGEIAGAATDVTEIEPPAEDHPFYDAPNLLMTPHLAGGSNITSSEGSRQWAENVIYVLTGKRPHGIVNPRVSNTVATLRANNDPRWNGFPDPVL